MDNGITNEHLGTFCANIQSHTAAEAISSVCSHAHNGPPGLQAIGKGQDLNSFDNEHPMGFSLWTPHGFFFVVDCFYKQSYWSDVLLLIYLTI